MPENKTPYAPSQKAQKSRTTGIQATSRRRMSGGRKIWYAIVVAIAKGISGLMWKTCKVETVIGHEVMDEALARGEPIISCYWHQMHMFCSRYMLDQLDRGMNVGFLISPSVSGEVPAAMARSWGASVVRGSPTRTGGQALRDMYMAVSKEKISPVITVDGPKGPAEEVKVGAVLLARLARAPMIPMAFAASRGKYWNSWDRFLVPAPFAKIAIVVGEPITVPAGTPIDELEPIRLELEQSLKDLAAKARSVFES